MALRMVEIVIPNTQRDALKQELERSGIEEIWEEDLLEDTYRVRILSLANEVEPITDDLQQRFSNVTGFRMIISPVEATIPRPDTDEEGDDEDEEEDSTSTAQVSREELHEELNDAVRTSASYLLMLCLSGIVASFGFYRDSIALLIGAMVIAPIIGPNVGLAFATTIGDVKLLFRSLNSTFLGALCVFGVVSVVGYIHPVELENLYQLQTFTDIGFGDLVLGLCAGTAGSLTYTRNFSTSLVGVMVAVALLPPMAAGGLLFGSSYFVEAGMAMLLALNNVISIIIASILTFLFQGIRPLNWWEEGETRMMSIVFMMIWALLLGLLVVITYYVQVT